MRENRLAKRILAVDIQGRIANLKAKPADIISFGNVVKKPRKEAVHLARDETQTEQERGENERKPNSQIQSCLEHQI